MQERYDCILFLLMMMLHGCGFNRSRMAARRKFGDSVTVVDMTVTWVSSVTKVQCPQMLIYGIIRVINVYFWSFKDF